MAKNTAAAAAAAAAAAPAGCACRCGQTAGVKATFRPGHDARMVSLTVADTIQGDLSYTNELLALSLVTRDDIQHHIDQITAAMSGRFGQALSAKYNKAVHNAWAASIVVKQKAEKKATAKKELADKKTARLAKATEQAAKQNEKSGKAKLTLVTDEAPAEPLNTVIELPSVRIGRWTYPSRSINGVVTRNEKRDGSGKWIPVTQ